MEKITTKQILEAINTHQYEQLDEYLSDVDWMAIEPATIVPQQEMRNFAKAINNKEVRLDVMQFLVTYAENYFMAGAERLVQKDYALRHIGASSAIIRTEAEHVISTLKKELGTQIKQLQSSGEFSGDKFSKLEKQVAQLKEENEQYKNANKFLQDKIDRFEHPEKYSKYIPSELRKRKFGDIMKYLHSVQIAIPIYADGDYGKVITCYQWYGGKGLFGYYVDKLNFEFELNEAREQLNWKIFEPAFNNYDKLIDEARKAVSNYKKDPKALLPAKADYIDDAIKYANGELEEKGERI